MLNRIQDMNDGKAYLFQFQGIFHYPVLSVCVIDLVASRMLVLLTGAGKEGAAVPFRVRSGCLKVSQNR